MKLERLHIEGFGRLAGLDLEFGDGLTVIAGPNEAGKSTIVECVIRLLFGFPEAQHNKPRKRFEPWSNGTPYAASLRYRLDDGRAFEVARDFGRPEVPTTTVEADTRRPVTALSGNKSTSPGESALQCSLDVYRAAAVVRAGDFAEGSDGNGAAHELAERLAKVIGAAGDASAAEAIARLEKARGEVGLSGANTPLGKAVREADEAEKQLQRFREEQAAFARTMRSQSELDDRARDLGAKQARCAAALAALRLRSIRARITEAADARAALEAAQAHRDEVGAAPPASPARRADIDAAIERAQAADVSAADAAKRAAARGAERDVLQREADGASAALLEKRAAAARLDEKVRAVEATAAGRPAITEATLEEIHRASDEADETESKARTLETAAAIARQRARPSPIAFALPGMLALISALAGFATHFIALWALAAVLFVTACAGGVAYAGSARRREAAISGAEKAAADATERAQRAQAALAERCRSLGCPDAAAVRAARSAQSTIDALRAERDRAHEAASLLAATHDALARRLADASAEDADRIAAQRRRDEARAALGALFDEIALPGGDIDERIGAYRRLLGAGENAARADAEIARARAALDLALNGATFEELEADAVRQAVEAASSGDPGEFADRSETELQRDLKALDAQRLQTEIEFAGARAASEEFERAHPVSAAELEERAAEAVRRRDRLREVRASLELAVREIEIARDAVHRDFTPVLNQAVSASAAEITHGRYAQAWVDQDDFAVRVRLPETGLSASADEALSTGTIEQLQFALRAALASALGGGERVPIIFDDALAHADDVRLRAAVERAAAIARDGDQILFFTQRGEAAELAGGIAGVKLIRLDGPAA